MQRFVLHHQFVKFYETELDKEKETEPAGAGVVTNGCGCHNYLLGNYEAHYDIISSHH